MFRHALSFSLALVTLGLLTATANAQNLLVNAGFEDPVLPSGGETHYIGGQNIGGWSVVGTGVELVQTNYAEPLNGINRFEAQEGLNSLDLTGDGNEGLSSGVQQTIATVVGTIYDLSFYVGRASGNQFYGTPSSVDVSVNGGARVSYTNSDVTPDLVNWKLFTTSFVATQSNTIVTFYNGTAGSNNNFAGLDNVVLMAVPMTVPEPGAFALLAGTVLFGGGLLVRRRKGRK